jgi:hypothetical protein
MNTVMHCAPRRRARSSEGGVLMVNTGKIATALVVAFLIFYIMTSPSQAANIVHATWHVAVNVAHGVGSFVDKLSS